MYIVNLDTAEEQVFPDRRVRNLIGVSENSPVGFAYIAISDEVGLHTHIVTDEYYLVLEGKGNLAVGEESRIIKRNDLVYIPKNTHHSIKKIGKEDLIMLVMTYPPWTEKDEISLEK